MVRLLKAIHHLDDDWHYFDETVDAVPVGGYEYFIRYTLRLKRGNTDEYYEKEESYLSTRSEGWDPVPLRSSTRTLNARTGEHKALETLLLWRCDFDSFLEEHGVQCKPAQ